MFRNSQANLIELPHFWFINGTQIGTLFKGEERVERQKIEYLSHEKKYDSFTS